MKKNLHACVLKDQDSAINFDKWQSLVNLISEIYGTATGIIVQLRDNEFNVVSASQNENNFLDVNSNWAWDAPSFCRHVVETEQRLYVPNAEQSEQFSKIPPVCQGPVRSYLGYPIYWPDHSLFGTICAIDIKPTDFSDASINLLEKLGNIIEDELQRITDYKQIRSLLEKTEEQQHQLEILALYDSLTGCANRNLLSDRFASNIARCERNQSSFSVIYMDLDEFKPINDQYGHKAGDKILSTIAKRIQANLRKTDLNARIGGDEFVVLFENQIDPQKIIENFRKTINDPISVDDASIQINASFGYSTFPNDGNTMDKLLEAADKRMYLEKSANQRY